MKRLIVTASLAAGMVALIAIGTPRSAPRHQDQTGKPSVVSTPATQVGQETANPSNTPAEDEAAAEEQARGRGPGGGFGGGRPGGGFPGGGQGRPPIGQPPIGRPPVGRPPVGEPPIGRPPIGQPPIGQPPIKHPPTGNPPIGQPPIKHPPTGNPPIGQPPKGGHPPIGEPGGPVVHPGPIQGHPGGPANGGVHIGKGTPPDIFRGGKPNQQWNPIGRVHNQREPVFVNRPYPGRWRPLPRYEYCGGFYFGSVFYVGPYPTFFGYGGWGPTEWIYDPVQGLWWSPTLGWVGAPPVLITDPITVAVQEQLPVLDQFGNQEFDPITGDPITETVTVYYNAYYDPIYHAYGYLGSDGVYVWLQW